MGQIVDKAASPRQCNELGPLHTISKGRRADTQRGQLYHGNFQIIISTYFFRSDHKCLPGLSGACMGDMVMGAHSALTCLHLQMMCSVDMDCVHYLDNYSEVYVALQLLARGSTWGEKNADEMIGVEPLACSKTTAGI